MAHVSVSRFWHPLEFAARRWSMTGNSQSSKKKSDRRPGHQQTDRMTSTQFFAVTAGMEVGAGLVLIVAPALVIRLLFGTFEIQTGVAIGRLAGAALVSLGAACWWARHDGGSAASRGLVSGLLTPRLLLSSSLEALARSVRPYGPWSSCTQPWPYGACGCYGSAGERMRLTKVQYPPLLILIHVMLRGVTRCV